MNGGRKGHRTSRNTRALLLLVILTAFVSSCSVPNLEPRECTESRDRVKQFYSLYFGTASDDREKNWGQFEKFLSPQLLVERTNVDPFTLSTEPPTTFKIGECKTLGSDMTDLQVQLYWRTDPVVVQKEVHVEMVRASDTWVIRKISN